MLVGLALMLAAPASGWGAGRVTLRPAAGAAGSSAVLDGSGFAPSSRIRVSATGVRTRIVRSSRHGSFAARLRMSGRGWTRVVSRTGHERVVNLFHFTAHGTGGGVVEVASSRGPRVRFSPGTVAPGGRLRVHGVGYRRSARLRLSGLGTAIRITASRRGRFDARIAVPAGTRPGALRVVLTGGGVRFVVVMDVRAPEPVPVKPAPAPVPAPAVPTLPPAPSNVSAPTITGTAWSGEVLSAGNGAWRGVGPIEYAYAWQRCDAGGATCTAIAGARAPRYAPADDDIGHRLRVAVTATNAGGSATATSSPTEVVTATPGVAHAPSVPATAREGDTIHVTPATFTGPAPQRVDFQWQRCTSTCVDIGSDETSYDVVTADIGARLQVVETATWSAKTLVLTSNKTDAVEPAQVPSGTVALWHMDDLGSTMTDSAGDHDGTLHGVTTGLPGFTGTAFGFNGDNSYVTVPNAADLSAVDQDVTLTIHMKTTLLPPSTVEDWDVIRSSGGYYDGDEYKMEYAPDGTAHCSFKGNGPTGYKEVVSEGAPALDDGNWHTHTIQCVKTATQVKTIVDGHVTAKSAQIGAITITKGMIIGAHSNSAGVGSSEFYDGSLDEASLQFG